MSSTQSAETKPVQDFIKLVLLLTLLISLTIALIIYNNSLRSAPIFMFLLMMGIGLMITNGLKRRGLLGLFILSLSIVVKQFIGAWSRFNLLFNLLESLLFAATLALSGYLYDNLQEYFEQFSRAKQQLKILDLEETGVGLIRPAIGLLRLKEETDRARRFRRPISLVLIQVQPQPGQTWERKQKLAVMRAIATTVKDATRVLDIPFLFDSEKIGLILTDTEINGTNKVINNIQRQLTISRVITSDGSSHLLQKLAIVRFGYSVFLGLSTQSIDLQLAADAALQRNIEMHTGDIFQNLFIDWEVLGESPTFSTINSTTSFVNGTINTTEINLPDTETSQTP